MVRIHHPALFLGRPVSIAAHETTGSRARHRHNPRFPVIVSTCTAAVRVKGSEGSASRLFVLRHRKRLVQLLLARTKYVSADDK